MSRQITHILDLTERLAAFENISHWTVSYRIFGKGDVLKRLRAGSDLHTRVAERALATIAEMWPADLEWPSDIPRPERAEPAEARHG